MLRFFRMLYAGSVQNMAATEAFELLLAAHRTRRRKGLFQKLQTADGYFVMAGTSKDVATWGLDPRQYWVFAAATALVRENSATVDLDSNMR